MAGGSVCLTRPDPDAAGALVFNHGGSRPETLCRVQQLARIQESTKALEAAEGIGAAQESKLSYMGNLLLVNMLEVAPSL